MTVGKINATSSGLIHRRYKPVHWSPSSRTALAEAELEYDEKHTSTAAFVKYPLSRLPISLMRHSRIEPGKIGAVIWTTTPWTIPANKAIALNKDFEYVIVEIPDFQQYGQLLIAKDRLSFVISHIAPGASSVEVIVSGIRGSEIADETFYHDILCRRSVDARPLLHAEFVKASTGSGLVHLAPGHGQEDFEICRTKGITARVPVDEAGCFTADAFPDAPELLKGKAVIAEGNNAVLDLLRRLPWEAAEHSTPLLGSYEIQHSYPVDWRTKLPVIIRSTNQWFANISMIKSQAVKSLERISFVPPSGRRRLESFIQNRNEWCISRQRCWGVPVPAIYRVDDGSHNPVMTLQSIDHIISVIQERGIDAWWTDADDDSRWVPPGLTGTYRRGRDTMDVWFDSGTSWTLLDEREALKPLADVLLEGTDQHRGWFQSLVLTQLASHADSSGSRPISGKILTHGFVLDPQNRKMSKSLGNVVSPDDIITGRVLEEDNGKSNSDKLLKRGDKRKVSNMGVDALRMWVASCDFTHDITLGSHILKSVYGQCHKLRTTFKWLLGVLADYDKNWFTGADDALATAIFDDYNLVDSLARHQLYSVVSTCHTAYENMEIAKAVDAISQYVNRDLSAFYFESVKDRLYAGSSLERRSAQAVLLEIFEGLQQILSPIVPSLVEETYEHTPAKLRFEHPLQRIWNFTQPSSKVFPRDKDGMEGTQKKIDVLAWMHDSILSAQEEARRAKKIGSGLECDVRITLPNDTPDDVKDFLKQTSAKSLESMFVVSRLIIDFTDGAHRSEVSPNLDHIYAVKGPVTVTQATGCKCPRCWRFIAEKTETLCGRCEAIIRLAKDVAV